MICDVVQPNLVTPSQILQVNLPLQYINICILVLESRASPREALTHHPTRFEVVKDFQFLTSDKTMLPKTVQHTQIQFWFADEYYEESQKFQSQFIPDNNFLFKASVKYNKITPLLHTHLLLFFLSFCFLGDYFSPPFHLICYHFTKI